jgi:tRNA pseudouridine38/39 synthase
MRPRLRLSACWLVPVQKGTAFGHLTCLLSGIFLQQNQAKSWPQYSFMEQTRDYEHWSRERLIERITFLEREAEQARRKASQPPGTTAASASARKPKGPKLRINQDGELVEKKPNHFDAARYSTRFIALKIAYLGRNYGGLEYSASSTRPSIEGELWKALVKSCLISPLDPDMVDFGPFEYSKCGRTDVGVSAFGQVVGIRVRSNRPLQRLEVVEPGGGRDDSAIGQPDGAENDVEDEQPVEPRKTFDPIMDEIPYCRQLNRLLPPDIRAIAWCPDPPPEFSARFSCRERKYRYFFTQPAYHPLPQTLEPQQDGHGNKPKNGWLDIGAMRKAAKLFEGVHDFRNFCKVDASKQITNFTRHIFSADIVEVPDMMSALPYLNGADFQCSTDAQPHESTGNVPYPRVFSFDVRGTAFLWHQIRHMVAMLFLVGQGLEQPSIVTALLDTDNHPRRPNYTMADEMPLVLWDCIFPDLAKDDPTSPAERTDSLNWLYLGEDTTANMHGLSGLADELWREWRRRKMDEVLANRLLDVVYSQTDISKARVVPHLQQKRKRGGGKAVFEGGDVPRSVGQYVPVLQKALLPGPEEVNDKWARQKGFKDAEELRSTGLWRAAIKARKDAKEEAGKAVMEEE